MKRRRLLKKEAWSEPSSSSSLKHHMGPDEHMRGASIACSFAVCMIIDQSVQ